MTAAAPRIAIVGGGITGRAAAHRLTELLPQAELAIFEASSRLGGVLETVHGDGFLIERSADNFLTKLPAVLDLCRRLGIADELIATDDTRRRAFVVRDGRLLPIPEGFFLMSPRKLRPILASSILSPRGKLRLLAEPFIARGPASQIPNQPPAPSPQPPADESVASFARRRLGREAFERLVQPLVAGIYTADPEKLSMAATMPEFLAQEREHGSLLRAARGSRASDVRTGHFSDQSTDTASGARYALFVTPKQGMTALTAAFANRLPNESIHLNTTAVAIRQTSDSRWQLEIQHPPSGSPPSALRPPPSFDALVLAVPAHAAARLLETCDPDLAAELSAIEYAGCAVVSLGFSRGQIAHPLDGFGFVVPQIEKRRIIAGSFASQKFPGRAPDGAVLIRTFLGGALRPDLLELPDDELRQVALDELRQLLGISGEPRIADIARWPRSMPQYHVGHLERIARIEQLASRLPNLALAGNAYHGVGIPQCIASAESAADQLVASLSGS